MVLMFSFFKVDLCRQLSFVFDENRNIYINLPICFDLNQPRRMKIAELQKPEINIMTSKAE